jgi:membrane associated rhomboid family serine protease
MIDHCPKCNGIWFDADELAPVLMALKSNDHAPAKEKECTEPIRARSPHTVQENDRFCPRCKQMLKKFNYGYDSNVFLDRCPDCQGIWTDTGEVKQIIEYLKPNPKAEEIGRLLVRIQSNAEDATNKPSARWFPWVPRIIIPIDDDLTPERFPFITLSLVIIYLAAFVAGTIINPPERSEEFLIENIFKLDFIGTMFSHSGPLILFWNILFLWLFGDNVEDRFSRLGYIGFLFFSGLLASFIAAVFGSNMLGTGACGAVSAIMGAYLVFYPAANIKLWVVVKMMEIPAYLCLGLWFVFQFAYPLFSDTERSAIVSAMASIATFLLGAAIALWKKTQKN